MVEFGTPNITRFGESALVLDVGAGHSLAVQVALGFAARELSELEGAIDVVAGIGNLTLFFDPRELSAERGRTGLVDAWAHACAHARHLGGKPIEIPVRYGGADGPDLEAVAAAHDIAVEECIARHVAGVYAVYVMGFAPGFAYLGGLDASLHTPRRAQPRSRVAAGSLAIGGSMTGVYPLESPGGWNVIGRTDLQLFDPYRTPASLLSLGDFVRFVRV